MKTLLELKREYKKLLDTDLNLMNKFREVQLKQDKYINARLRDYHDKFGDFRVRDMKGVIVKHRDEPIFKKRNNTSERKLTEKLFIELVTYIHEARKGNYEFIGHIPGKRKPIDGTDLMLDGAGLISHLESKIEEYGQSISVLESKLKHANSYMNKYNKHFLEIVYDKEDNPKERDGEYVIQADEHGNIVRKYIEPLDVSYLKDSRFNIEIINKYVSTLSKDDYKEESATDIDGLITSMTSLTE